MRVFSRTGGRSVVVATVVVLAFAGLLGPGSGSDHAGAAPAKPNFIVIMTDDQTVESMRVLPKVQARLATPGTTFDNNFVSYPLCCPSRATLLTGQYSHNHRVHGNTAPFGGYDALDHTNTLPVWLRAAGYHTTHIGKYLNGYGKPGRETEVPPGWSDWQATVGGSTYRMYDYTVNDNGTLVNYGSAPADYQTDVLAARAVQSIHERAAAGGPFFMWVAPLAPHSEGGGIGGPRAAPRHEGAFATEPLPRPPSFNEANVSDKPAAIRALPSLTPAKVTAITNRYRDRLESLLAVDDLVESIYQALVSEGLLSNTVIVFTSDNGFFHGEHRIQNGKNKLYEEAARVPLVVRGKVFTGGGHQSFLTSNVDLAATVVHMAGATGGRAEDGRSLKTLVGNPTGPGIVNRTLLLEIGDPVTGTASQDAIRTTRYKYVEWTAANGGVESELYDLTNDRYELVNQAGNPAFAAVRTTLDEKLNQLKTCAGTTCRVRYP